MVIALTFHSCVSHLGELTASSFSVNPDQLEVKGGVVEATIYGKIPAKYMPKNAIVNVTPQLRYGAGKTATGETASFQGEDVLGNGHRINYRRGGIYTMTFSFPYSPEMFQSELYMTFDAQVGRREERLPAVKVADGVIATSELYRKTLFNGGACKVQDLLKSTAEQKYEAQIKYLINESQIRQNEMKNNSVKEFAALLKRINRGSELKIKNIEIKAYASPEGGLIFNDDLANRRQFSAEDYVNAQLMENALSPDVISSYTAEDWDGLKQLVEASNIREKDAILNILSTYEDPFEREKTAPKT